MKDLKITKVYPIQDGKIISIPSEAWEELCSVINNIVNVVNNHSECIEEITQEFEKHENSSGVEIQNCKTDISKIAKILEDVYEKIQ